MVEPEGELVPLLEPVPLDPVPELPELPEPVPEPLEPDPVLLPELPPESGLLPEPEVEPPLELLLDPVLGDVGELGVEPGEVLGEVLGDELGDVLELPLGVVEPLRLLSRLQALSAKALASASTTMPARGMRVVAFIWKFPG